MVGVQLPLLQNAVFTGNIPPGVCKHMPLWVCLEMERGNEKLKDTWLRGLYTLRFGDNFYFFWVLNGKQCYSTDLTGSHR